MTSARGEVARKAIHVALSLVAALVVAGTRPLTAATILAAATLIALATELARRTGGPFGRAFRHGLGGMLRPAEAAGRLTGATTLALGYTIAAVALPGTPALAGILYAGVADAVAAVVGRLGRHRYRGGKSVEGSAAFAVVAFALTVGITGLGPAAAVAVALTLTAVEAVTLPVDDNLYLPVVGAAVIRVALGVTGAG